jgi:hypothetical protein
MPIELIPSAKRLIRSLRDIGYEFVDAVADIVDNSVEAQATAIRIDLRFDGENSYLTIADNGTGMTSEEIQESLRFGSDRSYDESNDLGRYGLGLKTASLSQCERMTVSSRKSTEAGRFYSYCWDLGHIESTNRWEVLEIAREELKEQVEQHLEGTTGTVVTWERLGRLLGYKYPSGEYAKRQADQMVASLKLHLGMIFHRFLSGEVFNRRISIYINDERVIPWDPYSRGESHTLQWEKLFIPLTYNSETYSVWIHPYILPPQALFSSTRAHMQASGPGKWNKQQGLYIYRANRLIQAGGWSGLRTSDEHTKLVRIAVFIPPHLDELFQVNVAKKHLSLPGDLRSMLLRELQPIVHKAQEVYRDRLSERQDESVNRVKETALPTQTTINFSMTSDEQRTKQNTHNALGIEAGIPTEPNTLATQLAIKAELPLHEEKFKKLIRTFFHEANNSEKLILHNLIQKVLIAHDPNL